MLSMMAWNGVMAQTAEEYEAALAAITDGGSYRISTTVDGTKYYVTNAGGLSSSKAAAGIFSFAKITEGGAYVYDGAHTATGIQITSTEGKRFTNGPLSDSHAVLNVSKFETSTNNRKDWEAQVFFLNKAGKYAIRSCNTAYGESSWADAGRTFWTYKVDPVTPQYSYDAAFVWDLEAYSVTPEQEAALATVKAWPMFIQGAAGLVKSADKFSSNAKESSEGTYEALLDDNYSTYFHSSWNSTAGGSHYLQAELVKPTQAFQFYFKKRQQNNNNRPTTIVVSASNDGQEFTEITTLQGDFPTSDYVIDYMSNVVDLGAAYKYVRFTVTATNNGAKNGGGEVFFTFSEFYMFPDAAGQLAPLYNQYTAAVADDLTPQDIATINAIDGAMKAAISTVNVTYALYEADGTTLVDSKEVVQEPNSDVIVPASLTSNSFYDYSTEGTVGTSDCTIKVIRTLKAGYVGALANLSNNKSYYITCDRGKFLTKDGYLASTAHGSLKSSAPTAFAILNYEDNYYLYSVADSKFVTNTGALAGNLMTDGFHGIYDAIQMTPKTVPYFFWYFTIAEGTNYGLNTNGNDPYGYVINDWMSADPGNQYYMVEAADFDPTEALDALKEYFHPSYTVTYVVKDALGNTIFASAPQPTELGAEITSLPDEYKRTYYTYNEVDVTISENKTTVEFTATWEGPFEISANFSTAHWYDMAMRGTWYVTSAVKDANDGDAYVTQNANTMGLVEDSYQWAFLGDGYNGFRIINKAEGEFKSFGYTEANKTNAGIPTVMDYTEGDHRWNIVASTNTSVPAGSFCLNVPGTNLYINQFGGAGGKVKFWDSTNNVGDPGSAFTIFDVPTNFANYVVDEITPYFPETDAKYFVWTDAAKNAIGYNDNYKTECSFAQYKSMKEALTPEFIADITNYVLPETGYYTLKNMKYNTYMGIDPSDANMYGNYATASAAKQIVKLTKTGDATYTIGLMGKFAPATVAMSTQVTATAEAGTYTVSVPTIGYGAFSVNPSEQYAALHCDAQGVIVGWEVSSDGSQWTVEDATSIDLTIGDAGYATAYLPFPVTAPQGVTVYTGELENTWLKLNALTGTIPTETAVILQGEANTYTFNIAAEAEPVSGNFLLGTLEPIAATGKYVLAKPEGQAVGFYKAESGNIAAGKAYLDLEAGVKAIFFTDGATGIANVEKSLENGAIYNVSGQRVNKALKGIYIVSGKKVVK